MGIKERERRVEVFLYGLFMDEELLCGKGLEPEGDEIAAIDGFALRIGQRAALVPTPGAKVYGSVFSLTRSELDRLYSESSIQAYKPQAVLAQLASGGVVAALCYNRRQPPSPTERNPEYAVKLRAVSQKVGLPADYIASRDEKSFCLKPVRFDLCGVASADPWYGTAISVAGVITTVLFVLGSPWIVAGIT
jgi:hypothetical protein